MEVIQGICMYMEDTQGSYISWVFLSWYSPHIDEIIPNPKHRRCVLQMGITSTEIHTTSVQTIPFIGIVLSTFNIIYCKRGNFLHKLIFTCCRCWKLVFDLFWNSPTVTSLTNCWHVWKFVFCKNFPLLKHVLKGG